MKCNFVGAVLIKMFELKTVLRFMRLYVCYVSYKHVVNLTISIRWLHLVSSRELDTCGSFFAIFIKEGTYVTSCSLSRSQIPIVKGVGSKFRVDPFSE